MPRTHSRLTVPLLAAALVLLLPAGAGATAASEPLRARNLPKDGKVAFYLGQDSTTLSDYKRDVLDHDPGLNRPAGVTLYTNLVGAPMSGMFQPTNYGSGDNNFRETLNQYGGGLAVGLYLSDPDDNALKAYAGVGDAAAVVRYRRWLDEFIRYLDKTDRQVFLRIGYEFDGPWNGYEPTLYKSAYRNIAKRIRQLGADRIATVWQSATWPYTEAAPYDAAAAGADHWDRWYPGDDAVDWIGLSHFYGKNYADYQWACNLGKVVAPPLQVQGSLLTFARQHRKPVFIAESAPQGFDIGNLTANCIFKDEVSGGAHTPVPVTAEQIWQAWYEPYFDFVEANSDVIRGISYINTHWSSQPMWTCVPGNCNSGYWGDSRVQANPLIHRKFNDRLANGRYSFGPTSAPSFEAPDFSRRGRSEAEYADLPQGGSTGIAIADLTASNDRSALVYAHGASLEFDHVAKGAAIRIRYASVTDGLSVTVLVNGIDVATLALPNRGSSTAWETATVETPVPADATVALRLNSGYVIWVDYITPGQQR